MNKKKAIETEGLEGEGFKSFSPKGLDDLNLTHERVKVGEKIIKSRLGESRKVDVFQMKRLPEVEDEYQKTRMKSFYPLGRKLSPRFNTIMDKYPEGAVFLGTLEKSKSLIAYDLHRDHRLYKYVNGETLLDNCLDDSNGGSSQYLQGFISLPLMYIQFGYSEPANKLIPQLIWSTMIKRSMANLKTWLFMPMPPAVIAKKRRGGAILEQLDSEFDVVSLMTKDYVYKDPCPQGYEDSLEPVKGFKDSKPQGKTKPQYGVDKEVEKFTQPEKP